MTKRNKGKQVAVVIGATSKWQADGRNTKLAHGKPVDDSALPVGVRWGVGGAIAQKFAKEGFFVVLTTRAQANAAGLAEAIGSQGGDCMIVELDLAKQESIAAAFATIRAEADLSRFLPSEEKVAVRIIHASGMVDVAGDIAMTPGFAEGARAALVAGAPILCDAQMVAYGVTRARLPANNEACSGPCSQSSYMM